MRTAQSEVLHASELKADDLAEVIPAELHCPERQGFGQHRFLCAGHGRLRSKQHLLS
jgi:hypothetical protein